MNEEYEQKWKHKKAKSRTELKAPQMTNLHEKSNLVAHPHPFSFMCYCFHPHFLNFSPISAKLGLLFIWGQLRDNSNAKSSLQVGFLMPSLHSK